MTTTYDLYEIPVDAIVERGYFESSFIDKIAYDRDGEVCYVVMHGDGYAYTGVPYAAFFDLFTADSPGHQYHEFSKQYGPGTYLNAGWDFVLRDEPVEDDGTWVGGSYGEKSTKTPSGNYSEKGFVSSGDANTQQPPKGGSKPPKDEEDLESDDYDEGLTRRVWALQNAAVVYQGRKTRGGEVINLAKRFEEYLNGS